jgi:polyhydroxybutyrate depolymerase
MIYPMKKMVVPCMILVILTSSSLLSGCLFKRWDDPNTTVRSLLYDGIERSYRLHIPPGFDEDNEGALLFVLHGGGGTARGMENYLTRRGFNRLSDEQGFIVVYPDGFEKHWNDGRKNVSWQEGNVTIDDVGFLCTLIDMLLVEFDLDAERVFCCGISNGGQMSYRLACERTDKLAGIATVVSSLSEDLVAGCEPSGPLPVFMTVGTDDPLVPFEGGEIQLFNNTYGQVISVNETVDYWVTNNDCDDNPVISYLPDPDPTDGVRVRTELYGNGDNETQVLLYVMEGGGHTWPGGPQYFRESIIGKTCYDFDACEAIWKFFQESSRL